MTQVTTLSPTGSRSKTKTLFRNLTLATALIAAPLAMPSVAEAAPHGGGGHFGHGGGGHFGGGHFGGGHFGGRGGGRFWGGRWYGYGVGPCWRWNPFYARWVWVCY